MRFHLAGLYGRVGKAGIEEVDIKLVGRPHEIEHRGCARLVVIRPGVSPRSGHALDATDQQGTLSVK